MVSSVRGAMVLVRPAAVMIGTASCFSSLVATTILPLTAKSSIWAVPFRPWMYQRGRLIKLLVPTSTVKTSPSSKVKVAVKPSSTSSLVTLERVAYTVLGILPIIMFIWSSRWTPQSSTMPPPCSLVLRQSPGMPREPWTRD